MDGDMGIVTNLLWPKLRTTIHSCMYLYGACLGRGQVMGVATSQVPQLRIYARGVFRGRGYAAVSVLDSVMVCGCLMVLIREAC